LARPRAVGNRVIYAVIQRMAIVIFVEHGTKRGELLTTRVDAIELEES